MECKPSEFGVVFGVCVVILCFGVWLGVYIWYF